MKPNIQSLTAKLSSTTTVGEYQQLEAAQDKTRIALFIEKRFVERYFDPLSNDKSKKNGFCTMSICCLLIETLESFWQGMPDTRGRDAHGRSNTEVIFEDFFIRNKQFCFSKKHAVEFYRKVRCGILHQAETKGGWRITRNGPLFDAKTLTINATKFHHAMRSVIAQYKTDLEQLDWSDQVWLNFRKKMKAICANC